MAELREFLPYLIVLFLMWNAKQETYFDKSGKKCDDSIRIV